MRIYATQARKASVGATATPSVARMPTAQAASIPVEATRNAGHAMVMVPKAVIVAAR